MYCTQCGQNNADDTRYCTSCGAPLTSAQSEPQQPAVAEQPVFEQPQQPAYEQPVYQQPVYEQPVYQQPQQSASADPGRGLAIAGMVLGIVSFLCFPYITGVLGIVFGCIAKSKGCRSGMATAGIATGIVGLALQIISLIACTSPAGMLDAFYSLM